MNLLCRHKRNGRRYLAPAVFLALLLLPVGDGCAQPAAGAALACPQALLNRKVAVIMGSAGTSTTLQSNSGEPSDQIRSLFEGRLLALSFQPIDQAVLTSQLPEKQKQLLLQGDVVGAANLAERLGADLLLLGQLAAQSQKLTSLNSKMVSVSLQFSLKLIDGPSAKVLASTNLIDKTAGLDAETAVIKLLSKKADELVSDLFRQYCAKASVLLPQGPPPRGADSSAELPHAGNAPSGPANAPAPAEKKPEAGGSVNEL